MRDPINAGWALELPLNTAQIGLITDDLHSQVGGAEIDSVLVPGDLNPRIWQSTDE
jgi:hypothetical protein